MEKELKEKLRRLKISRTATLKNYLISKTASMEDLTKISQRIRVIEKKLDKIRINRMKKIMGI